MVAQPGDELFDYAPAVHIAAGVGTDGVLTPHGVGQGEVIV